MARTQYTDPINEGDEVTGSEKTISRTKILGLETDPKPAAS